MEKKKNFKYMNLLNAFECKIIEYEVQNQYENLLINLICTENNYVNTSEAWKTLVRKRILSLLLYVHWFCDNSHEIINDFFIIWDFLYPNNSLPKKSKK